MALSELLIANCNGMDDETAAKHLNAAITLPGHLTLTRDLLKYNAVSGVIIAIEDDAKSNGSPTRKLSHSSMLALNGNGIDFSDNDNLLVLDALVAAKIVKAEDKLALIAIAVRQTTLAIEAGLGKVKVGHVQGARK